MAEKEIDWRGTSREDLIAFPEDVRRTAGFELAKVQHGLYPTDWKPISIWVQVSLKLGLMMQLMSIA